MNFDGKTIFLSDSIGAYDPVDSLLEQIGDARDLELVLLGVNGGDARNALKLHDALKGRVRRCEIYKFAVSAGVLVAMCADEIAIEATARLCIHPACVAVYGNWKSLKLETENLEILTTRLVGIVSARTGQSEEIVRGWYSNVPDFYATADEAILIGLADKVFRAKPVVSAALSPVDPEKSNDAPLFWEVVKAFGNLNVPDREKFFSDLYFWAHANVKEAR